MSLQRLSSKLVKHKDSNLFSYLDDKVEHPIHVSDIRRYGGKCDGVTDDTQAVLDAIQNTGGAHILGNCKLSRFDWPKGATLTGNANIVYDRRPSVPCKIDGKPMDHSKMKCAYVFGVHDICEMLQLKTAGFNTIIHYGYSFSDGGSFEKACNAAEAVGIKVIINSPNDNPPASDIALGSRSSVIGYYIFDEPQHNSVRLEEQNARITAWRNVTDKMLCVADNGIFGFDNDTFSDKYDIVFVDQYHIGSENDDNNKAFSVLGWVELSHKAGNAKLIPAVGLFLGDSQTDKPKMLKMASHVFKFGSGDMAVFAWDSSASDARQVDLLKDKDFYNKAVSLNAIYHQEPYRLECLYFGNKGLQGLTSGINKAYTSANVSPFRVIPSGSAQDERHQVFGDIGLAFKNEGGLAALNLSNLGYLCTTLHWRDHAAGGTGDVTLVESEDDYYTNNNLLTKQCNHNTGFTAGVNTRSERALGIKVATASNSQYFFKFLSGVLVTCSCGAWSL